MIFAFYGSLRAGQYNHKRFDLDTEGKKIGTYVVPGFKMMSVNNWYPMVFPADKPDDTIVVDLIEIKDRQICNFIESMERGAGYVAQKIVVEETPCTIYVAASDNGFVQRAQIPSGDWVKYNTELQNGARKSESNS